MPVHMTSRVKLLSLLLFILGGPAFGQAIDLPDIEPLPLERPDHKVAFVRPYICNESEPTSLPFQVLAFLIRYPSYFDISRWVSISYVQSCGSSFAIITPAPLGDCIAGVPAYEVMEPNRVVLFPSKHMHDSSFPIESTERYLVTPDLSVTRYDSRSMLNYLLSCSSVPLTEQVLLSAFDLFVMADLSENASIIKSQHDRSYYSPIRPPKFTHRNSVVSVSFLVHDSYLGMYQYSIRIDTHTKAIRGLTKRMFS